MAQMQLHTTCDNCISLVQHAATILQFSDEVDCLTRYDKQYQSQLLANVASSKCHMCTLLHAHIPGLSEPFEFGLELYIGVFRVPKNPVAVRIKLQGQEHMADPLDWIIYPNSLRVHEGEI